MPPQTIEESARLNTGQCGTWIQSTTQPRSGPGERSSRSVRLPIAPPSSRPSVIAQGRLRIWREVRSTNTITPTAIAVNSTVIEGPPMLNAAPGLRDTRSVRKPPSSTSGGRSDSVATTVTLDPISAARTATATASRAPTRRRAGREASGSPGSADPDSAGVSAVPRAACTSRTGSRAGTPAAAPSRSARRTIRMSRMYPLRFWPAPARSGLAARGRCA